MSPEELRAAMQDLCATVERGGSITPATVTLARMVRVALERDTPEARARASKAARMRRWRAGKRVDGEASTEGHDVDASVDARPSTERLNVDGATSTRPSTPASTATPGVDARPSTPASTLARAVSEKDLRSPSLREEKETQNAREAVDARPSTPASTLRPIARAARDAARADLVAQLERNQRRMADVERSWEERKRGEQAVERLQRDLIYFDTETAALSEARSA